MVICIKCKEEICQTESAVVGGYICKVCGKFNPRQCDKTLDKASGHGSSCKKSKEVGKVFRKFNMELCNKNKTIK